MARRRKQGAEQAPAGPGAGACPLCGEVVPVGEDGRCGLGHRVRQPAAAAQATEPLSHVDVVDRGVAVPAAGVAGPAAAGLAAAGTVALDEEALAQTVDLGSPAPTEDEPVDIAPVDADRTPADSPDDADATDEAGEPDDADADAAAAADTDFSSELDW